MLHILAGIIYCTFVRSKSACLANSSPHSNWSFELHDLLYGIDDNLGYAVKKTACC